MTFLNVNKPTKVGPICGSLENALWRNAGIRIHVRKTQIWNQAASDPRFAMLWRGLREGSTQQQQCGEGRCWQPINKASNCWERRANSFSERCHVVADVLVRQLEGHPHTPNLRAASEAAWSLHGILGGARLCGLLAVRNGTRPWDKTAWGERPREHTKQLPKLTGVSERRTLLHKLTGQVLVRSQGGPGAGLAIYLSHVSHHEDWPQLFKVILLHLPLPLTVHSCRCGLPLDAWVLGKRGCALETVTTRICCEASGRVMTDVMVCDLDLAEPMQQTCATWRSLLTGCRSYQVLLELPGQGQGAFRVASDAETRRAGLATSLGFPVFLHSSTLRCGTGFQTCWSGHVARFFCSSLHDVCDSWLDALSVSLWKKIFHMHRHATLGEALYGFPRTWK